MFLRPVIAMVVTAVLIYGLWMLLNGYFAPHKAAGKRELIQSMALIVGGVVAFGTLFVSYRNLRHSQETALSTQQNTQAALEEQRELDEGRRQDEALQTYLGQMSQLLTDKNLRGKPHWLDDARVTARVQSLVVLSRVGGERKKSVLQFLYEAQLINKEKKPLTGEEAKELGLDGPTQFDARIVGLSGADLTSADLTYITLNNAALNGAFLDNADLRRAKLNGVDLGGAYLSGADLRDAELSGASLVYAHLQRKDEFSLRGADLSGASLSGADLSGADLSGASLSGASLSGADLGSANGVTKEQLEQQAESLEGTIMPDGTIYPGRYAAREFEPALSFSVSDGWRRSYHETTDALSIERLEGGQLIFTSPRHVYDPSNPSDPKEVPAPKNTDEWVFWFQSHPNLNTSEPVPVSVVGGASAKRIDVTASSTPENYHQEVCGEQPCIPLYPSGETAVLSYEEFKNRFVIMDVGGATVIIDVAAPADKFDELLPKAQKVLDTVEWKGG